MQETRSPGSDDPAYDHEFEQLAEVCRFFLEQREAGHFTGQLLATGMITGQCAVIYKLSPPGRLIDIPKMFEREEDVSAER